MAETDKKGFDKKGTSGHLRFASAKAVLVQPAFAGGLRRAGLPNIVIINISKGLHDACLANDIIWNSNNNNITTKTSTALQLQKKKKKHNNNNNQYSNSLPLKA